jgi:hypothetical protein
MEGDPAHVTLPALDLPGVDAGPDLNLQRVHRLAHGAGIGDRLSRRTEGGHDLVTLGEDLASVVLDQMPVDQVLETVEHLAPGTVTQSGRALG